MADHDAPILRGEMLEIVRRLDERISALDRTTTDLRSVMQEQLRHVGARLLSLENWMRTFMVLMVIALVGIAAQLLLTFLKP